MSEPGFKSKKAYEGDVLSALILCTQSSNTGSGRPFSPLALQNLNSNQHGPIKNAIAGSLQLKQAEYLSQWGSRAQQHPRALVQSPTRDCLGLLVITTMAVMAHSPFSQISRS